VVGNSSDGVEKASRQGSRRITTSLIGERPLKTAALSSETHGR
jgi:hypothetical protein